MQTHFDCEWADAVLEHLGVGEQVFMPSTPGSSAHGENAVSPRFSSFTHEVGKYE
jgi:hypothetical protein